MCRYAAIVVLAVGLAGESWSAEAPSGRYIDVTEVFSFDETDLECAKVRLSADATKAAILARRNRGGNELWLADLQQMRKKLVRRGWARRDFISSVAGFVAGDEDILCVYGPDGVGKGTVHFLHTIPTAGGEPQPLAEEKGFSQYFRCWLSGKRSFLYERVDSASERYVRELRIYDLDSRSSRKVRDGGARKERFCALPGSGEVFRAFYARDEADGSWLLVFSAVSLPAYEEDIILAKWVKKKSYFNLFAVGENNLVCSFQGGPTMLVDTRECSWRQLFEGEVLDMTPGGKGILRIPGDEEGHDRFLLFEYDPRKAIFPEDITKTSGDNSGKVREVRGIPGTGTINRAGGGGAIDGSCPPNAKVREAPLLE